MEDGQRDLTPLKTVATVRESEETAEALVVEIPIRIASKVQSILKPLLSIPDTAATLHHLRRLVTRQHLPTHLQSSLNDAHGGTQTIFFLFPPPQPADGENILTALRPYLHEMDDTPTILATRIPLYPPTSAEQAATWSSNYWPCTYNPASQTIQSAPPLQLLRNVQAELETPRLAGYIRLARLAATEGKTLNIGRQFGAVIVDPIRKEVLAVAGDARWWTDETRHTELAHWGNTDGRPENHALMRAIAMVAGKELERRKIQDESNGTQTEQSSHLEYRPVTNIEKYYFNAPAETVESENEAHGQAPPPRQSRARPDTYLCNGLDVYLTHEPCVCCSMAMIHSRFRACVFEKRMPGTGGLCAEKEHGGLGYGMFWRKELNWRVMTFEYKGGQGEELEDKAELGISKVEAFHA